MTKKDAILERSTDIFFKFGLSKISMDELADQIGISKKTIYNNFGSKENLLEQIIFSSMEGLLDYISDLFTSNNKTILEKIYLAINHLYQHYTNFEIPSKFDANAARIIFSPKCVSLNGQIQAVIEELAIAAKKSGIVKESIDVKMIPYVFLNSIRGLATWEKPESIGFTKIELLKFSIGIILDGILTTEAMEEYLSSN